MNRILWLLQVAIGSSPLWLAILVYLLLCGVIGNLLTGCADPFGLNRTIDCHGNEQGSALYDPNCTDKHQQLH